MVQKFCPKTPPFSITDIIENIKYSYSCYFEMTHKTQQPPKRAQEQQQMSSKDRAIRLMLGDAMADKLQGKRPTTEPCPTCSRTINIGELCEHCTPKGKGKHNEHEHEMKGAQKPRGYKKAPIGRTVQGLTANDWQQLSDLLTKANDGQLYAMMGQVKGEMHERRMQHERRTS